MGRLCLVMFVAGAAWVQTWAGLPAVWGLALLLSGALALFGWCWRSRAGFRGHPTVSKSRRRCLRAALLLAAFLLGTSNTAWRAHWRLADALDPSHESSSMLVVVRIAGLPERADDVQRAVVDVLEARPGVPSRMQLAWFGDMRRRPEWLPGQHWEAYVVPKRPNGSLNPHGFDYEALMFERGIRASATVRGTPKLVADKPFAHPVIAVQRLRHWLRGHMQEAIGDARYGAVLIALAMGDQAGVARADWTVFNRTGITHLVSISGMHVTMLAAMAGLVVLRAWSRARWRGTRLAEHHPAQVVAAGAALVTALAYCLLAGWGVPAQRTFFMLAVLASAAILRLPISGTRVLALAAGAVIALDPWAALAPGFWLSFGAVCVLMLAGTGRIRLGVPGERAARPSRWAKLRRGLMEATRVQAAITVGLVPLLALIFQQISLVSPLANALAIPIVTFLVTPLALVVMALAAVPGMDAVAAFVAMFAHQVFAWMMVPMEAMAAWRGANFAVAAVPWPWIALAMMGLAWTLQPRGLPGRWLALLLLVPVLAYRPDRPAQGDWILTALDVGQGGAIVIETATQVLAFDAGPRYGPQTDAGDRVVWPYLRARGVRVLDELVVSHGDADHAGGLASLLEALPVSTLRAPATMHEEVARARPASREPAPFLPCEAGQEWKVDGVTFRFLSPEPGTRERDRNAGGCVLWVGGRTHRVLLMGDVGVAQEAAIVARKDWPGPVDVVIAGHHGSRTSSGAAFVKAAQARHAVIQAGYLNRYGHPHATVVARWTASGAILHRTDHHGAVRFLAQDGTLTILRQRDVARRYWHTARLDAAFAEN